MSKSRDISNHSFLYFYKDRRRHKFLYKIYCHQNRQSDESVQLVQCYWVSCIIIFNQLGIDLVLKLYFHISSVIYISHLLESIYLIILSDVN